MSIQTVINSAQTIEVSRPALVASTLSRSGRLYTSTRNWAKPWRFTVNPKPVWRIADARPVIESIMAADRYTEQTVYLGTTAQWLTAYQGTATVSAGAIVGVTCTSATGTTLNISYTGLSNGVVILKAGDIIQPADHRYPYSVVNTITATGATGTAAVTLHRGFLPQTGYNVANQALLVGAACGFKVKVNSLPAYRFLPSQLVEFTGEFELIESIE
jgi:hypothetical protein